MRRIIWLLLLAACLIRTAGAQDRYKYFMELGEQGKRTGDFAAMEEAIQQALRFGRGDEYAWRSLAWAQGRQGKWNESLQNAQKNIVRNGATGWSLAQLADSSLGYGDFELANQALARAKLLPPAKLANAEEILKPCTDRLLAATCLRDYQLQFKVDLQQGGPEKKPVWLLMPQLETPLQSFSYTVRDVVSYKERHISNRDYLEVVQTPGKPFYIVGKLILKPFCLGTKRLDQVPKGGCPEELKVHLTQFQNFSWWDPGLPEVQAIAKIVKGRTSAETVQNILDWFKKNIRYDATIEDDPALGQLGTILKLRYGGCHHNSGLFVTLCRAAGVPACVAHGLPLPMEDKPFEMKSPIGHGWAEVYLNDLGWVPVEPTDADSLRLFTANRAYLSVGASNRPPEHHYFSGTIRYEGNEFQTFTIQHCLEVSGALIRVELPKNEKLPPKGAARPKPNTKKSR